jgi:hypothetical protein
MEATRKRTVKSGEEFNHLFIKAEGNSSTIQKNANVTHTVAFIPKVVSETLDQTKKLSEILKGVSAQETCSNIWHFVYSHIAYKKDEEGFEQIRSPSRTWHDRKKGVDCDCYSVFISSILTNIQIPHILRITKYHRDYFQHIYPVVLLDEKQIIMDCVTDKFNYEVPYTEKKDYPMELQYLNGFDGDGMEGLGKLLAKKIAKASKKGLPVQKKKIPLIGKAKTKKAAKQPAQNNGQQKPKKKGLIKKVLNKVNKVNPATVLLRNGVLAAMKLNVKNIAKRLRWSYLSPEQAAQKGIDATKFQRLIATRQKLEKIFYGAGGNEKNLKKAILGGKGNSDKAINGLEGFAVAGTEYMSADTPLPQLLGREVYYSENIEGFEGLGQLGEPVTLAAVGAAMGVLAGIVAALKQIGDIFPKKTKGSEDFDEKTNEAAENNVPIPGTTPVPSSNVDPETTSTVSTSNANSLIDDSYNSSPDNSLVRVDSNTTSNSLVPTENDTNEIIEEENGLVTQSSAEGTKEAATTNESFWDKNKSWLKPVAIGVGGISLIAIGFAVLKPKPAVQRTSSHSLSGIPNRKKKKRNYFRKQKHKSKPSKKTAVALL